MNHAATESLSPPALASDVAPGLSPATITAVESPGRTVVCRVGEATVRATLAVAGGYVPRVGDTVLVAPTAAGAHYVLGVVTALREASVATAGLTAADGAVAKLARDDDDDEVLRVQDPAGRPLFEYRAGDGRCRVYAPDGDLEFRAERGSIELVAARRVGVRAPEVVLEGTRAEARFAELSLHAQVVSTVVERARHVAGVLETRAGQIFEWAKLAVREAEELAETRAAQVRLIATEAFALHSKRALVKADEDIKLKAEQIHLA